MVSRAKEVECNAPDSLEKMGSIQLVIVNQGHMQKVEHKDRGE